MISLQYYTSSHTKGIKGCSKRFGHLGLRLSVRKAYFVATKKRGDSTFVTDIERLSCWSSLDFAREVNSIVIGKQVVATGTSSTSYVASYCKYRVGRYNVREPRGANYG